MLMENCETGSQLRKAISHVFGRNKMCTRQIPDYVWVHYCRKHYQRVRYRNVQKYAELQIDMVIKQVYRVQAWSRQNAAQNKAGQLTAWQLMARKREKMRLENAASPQEAGCKRFHSVCIAGDQKIGDGAEGCAEPERKKGSTMPNEIPPWLHEKCGQLYNTEQVLEMLREIERQIKSAELVHIPDIEVLPQLTTDPAEESRQKYKRRSQTTVTSHNNAPTFEMHYTTGGVTDFRPIMNYSNTCYPGTGHPAYPSPWTNPSAAAGPAYRPGNPYAGAGAGYMASNLRSAEWPDSRPESLHETHSLDHRNRQGYHGYSNTPPHGQPSLLPTGSYGDSPFVSSFSTDRPLLPVQHSDPFHHARTQSDYTTYRAGNGPLPGLVPYLHENSTAMTTYEHQLQRSSQAWSNVDMLSAPPYSSAVQHQPYHQSDYSTPDTSALPNMGTPLIARSGFEDQASSRYPYPGRAAGRIEPTALPSLHPSDYNHGSDLPKTKDSSQGNGNLPTISLGPPKKL